MNIEQLLEYAVKNKASDLHLSVGLPVIVRIDGDIRRINSPVLTNEVLIEMAHSIMNEKNKRQFEQDMQVDLSYEVPGLSRFRVNVYHQNRGIAMAVRTIPSKILTLEDIKAPNLLRELALKPRGLVLITGPTGAGKSTTLAAMIDYYNSIKSGHILTIEDPVEFIHEPKRSMINQREVGVHARSFAAALKAALREDPDVILVGEMRDLETIRLALEAAETGHLVLATLHTSGAAKTIDRIVNVFPSTEQAMVRTMISESLEGIVSQTLCKRKDVTGRVLAFEIMLGIPAIRNLIRENKVPQMNATIQLNRTVGMRLLDDDLKRLVDSGIVAAEEALSKAQNPDAFLI